MRPNGKYGARPQVCQITHCGGLASNCLSVTFATGSIDGTPPPPISTLNGSWKRTRPNRFDSTTYFFAFDLAGKAIAMIKNNIVFHLKGRNELTGFGIAFDCDLQAENCTPAPLGPIRIMGKRIVPERVEEKPADNPASE